MPHVLYIDKPEKVEEAALWLGRLATAFGRGKKIRAKLEVQENQRSISQNDLMWACLTDFSEQVEYHGHWLTPDDWKLVLYQSWREEVGRMVPSLDGRSIVPLVSTSKLTSEEFKEFLDHIIEYAAPLLGVQLKGTSHDT